MGCLVEDEGAHELECAIAIMPGTYPVGTEFTLRAYARAGSKTSDPSTSATTNTGSSGFFSGVRIK